MKILRSEVNGDFEYSIEDDIVVISGNEEVFRVPILKFREKAQYLLTEIQRSSGSFAVPDIEEFMQSINCRSVKASSSAKTDITIVIHDHRTGLQPSLGFSIKSQLGNPSTLLNAGETTNFIYMIKNAHFTNDEIREINSISTRSKIKDRVSKIRSKGGSFEFVKPQRAIFNNNLILIDSLLPHILSFIVLNFYSSNYSKNK